MSDKSSKVLVFLAAAQVAMLVPVVAVDPEDCVNSEAFQYAVGTMLGCVFAHVALAATWTALGPLTIGPRLFGSLLWLLLAVSGVVINVAVNNPGSSDISEALVFFGPSILAMWLVIQTPLWIARLLYRFRIAPCDESQAAGPSRPLQFGIRQLLIVTTAAASVLALGRALVAQSGTVLELERSGTKEFIGIGLIVVCNSLVAFNVITGALLPRRWLFGITLGICGAAAVTLVEWRMSTALGARHTAREMIEILATMNAIQFGWLLINLGVLRWAGYGLVNDVRMTPQSSAAQKATEPAG